MVHLAQIENSYARLIFFSRLQGLPHRNLHLSVLSRQSMTYLQVAPCKFFTKKIESMERMESNDRSAVESSVGLLRNAAAFSSFAVGGVACSMIASGM